MLKTLATVKYIIGVFLVRIQSECGKIRTRKTTNTDTFHAALVITILHIPTHLCKAKYQLVMKYIAAIFNLKLLKPKLNNIWDLDVLVKYFKRLGR